MNKVQSSPLDRAYAASLWGTLEIASRYTAQFLVLILLARLLTPSDFGLIAMALVFTSLGALLVDSGFSLALIRRQNTNSDDETTVFITTLSTSLLITVLLWSTAPLISDLYSYPELTSITRALGIILPLGALSAVPEAILLKQLKFKVRARIEVIASAAGGLVALGLALGGFGVWSLVGQSAVSVFVRMILLFVFTRWKPRGRFSLNSLSGMFGFGGYVLVSNLLDVVGNRLQSFLIGKLFDSNALGYYTIAQNAQQAPSSFFAAVLNRIGFPIFSSIAGDEEKLTRSLRMSLRLAMFIYLPIMICLAVVAEPLVNILFGRHWSPAAPILSILSLSAALWPLHVLNLSVINALGRSDLFFKITLTKKILLITLILMLSPGGPLSIALAVLITSSISLFINTYHTGKLLGYGFLAQCYDQFGTVSLTLFAASIGYFSQKLEMSDHWLVLVSVMSGMTAYVSGAFLVGSRAFYELRSAAKSIYGAHVAR